MSMCSIQNALDVVLKQESERRYNEAIKGISVLIISDQESPTSTQHDENVYIIGASQALMVVFDKSPDKVEADIRAAVRALELEEE